MTEKWQIDENGFVTTEPARVFFDIVNAMAFVKSSPTKFFIVFKGAQVENEFPNTEDRDGIFGMLVNWRIESRKQWYKECTEREKLQTTMQTASLEIQNKLAGTMCR